MSDWSGQVDASGTLVEGGAEAVVSKEMLRALETIGEEGTKMIRVRLDKVLQNPTGHYRSRIDYTIRSDEMVEIHDSGVIYGPWLENGRSGTRFRGYSTFRRTMQEIEGEAKAEAESAAKRMAKGME